MRNDFEMIVHELAWDMPHVNVYPIGDLHIGSAQFDIGKWKKVKQMILADPYAKVVLVGDMMDNGLKNSKTNPYEATMRPREQKEWLKRELADIADKIIAATDGNHEKRSINEVDDSPLYDVLCKLDLEDLFRENMAFIKINVGQRNADRQVSYSIALTHGSSKAKTQKFTYAIDGVDIFINGHTHQPNSGFPAKIVMDTKNNVVKLRPYTHLVVPAFTAVGGYSLAGLYLPQDHSAIPMLTLDGNKKEVKTTWVQ